MCKESMPFRPLLWSRRRLYCINASCLNFVEDGSAAQFDDPLPFVSPFSWWMLDTATSHPHQQLRNTLRYAIKTNTITVGAGCFWHIEGGGNARRLAGVVDTAVGYAGGATQNPSYEEVCHQGTRHAEVVMTEYDPTILSSRVLVESFLALHDPTKVRAHGKHVLGTGQYRSCLFVLDSETFDVASAAL